MRIEDVLSPISPMQPEVEVPVKHSMISRIPIIIDQAGNIDPKFQIFYDNIVQCITNLKDGHSIEHLYALSDKATSEQEFYRIVDVNWKTSMNLIDNASPNNSNIDIQIDVESFRNLHRSILGQFNVIAYVLGFKYSDIRACRSSKLIKYKLPIYFTYKDNEFKLISHFSPFIVVDDE